MNSYLKELSLAAGEHTRLLNTLWYRQEVALIQGIFIFNLVYCPIDEKDKKTFRTLVESN